MMDFSLIFENMLNTLIYLAVIMLFFNLLLVRKQRNIYAYFLFFTVCFVLTYLLFIFDWFSVLRTVVMIVGSLVFFFKGTFVNKVMASALLVQLAVILDFIHAILLMATMPVLKYDAMNGSALPDIYLELVVVMVLIVFNLLRREKTTLIQYFDKKYILIWLLITLNFVLFISVVTSLEFSSQMKGIIAAILVLTSGINIYFCYFLEKTQRIFEENLVITKQVEFQENKLKQNQAYLEKNNRLMHDIKRHYLEIEHALSENQLNYVKEYMKGVYQQYFDSSGTRFTGNQVVDSMFFSLKDQCEKEGIELDYTIHIDKQIGLDEKDLAVLLGSLFDRAVKEARQSSHDRRIKINMLTKNHHVVLMIEHPKEVKLGLPTETVSQWEHSQIINRIIEKNSGMYEVTNKSNRESAKIVLPIRQEEKWKSEN